MPATDHNGTRIAWRDTGCGETVALVHASASSSGQWRSLTAVLAGDCRVVAPDLYGYGETGAWSGARRFALADEAALVEAALPAGAVHIVGHSYGGAVALRFALQQPERVRSLVLIEPVAFHLLREQAPHEESRRLLRGLRAVASQIAKATANGNYRGAMARFVDYWNGTGAWKRLDPLLQADLARRVPKIALDFWAAMTEPTAPSDYRRINSIRRPGNGNKEAWALYIFQPGARCRRGWGASGVLAVAVRGSGGKIHRGKGIGRHRSNDLRAVKLHCRPRCSKLANATAHASGLVKISVSWDKPPFLDNLSQLRVNPACRESESAIDIQVAG